MTRKTNFFEGCCWFKFNNLGLARGMTLIFYTSVSKGLKLKVSRFRELIPTFVKVTGEKVVVGCFCPTPLWVGLQLCWNHLDAFQDVSSCYSKIIWLLYRNIFPRTYFLRISLVAYLFYCKLFFMNCISGSFNISNFISSRSQLFDYIDVIKKLRNIQRKIPVLKSILIKLQASPISNLKL